MERTSLSNKARMTPLAELSYPRDTTYTYSKNDPRVLHTYIHPCCKDEDVIPPLLYGIARHEVWTTHCAHPEAHLPEDTNSRVIV